MSMNIYIYIYIHVYYMSIITSKRYSVGLADSAARGIVAS